MKVPKTDIGDSPQRAAEARGLSARHMHPSGMPTPSKFFAPGSDESDSGSDSDREMIEAPPQYTKPMALAVDPHHLQLLKSSFFASSSVPNEDRYE